MAEVGSEGGGGAEKTDSVGKQAYGSNAGEGKATLVAGSGFAVAASLTSCDNGDFTALAAGQAVVSF